jgi:hypothetical protein
MQQQQQPQYQQQQYPPQYNAAQIQAMQQRGGGNIPVPQQQQQTQRGGSRMTASSAGPAPPQTLSSSKRAISTLDPSSSSSALTSHDILKQHKRRKPTSRSLPLSLLSDGTSGSSSLKATAEAYEQLLEKERELDLVFARRKAELGDEIGNLSASAGAGGGVGEYSGKRTVHRVLRVRVGNTCSDQEWQQKQAEGEEGKEESVDFESGKGVPKWTCTIEGRLLDVRSPFPSLLSFLHASGQERVLTSLSNPTDGRLGTPRTNEYRSNTSASTRRTSAIIITSTSNTQVQPTGTTPLNRYSSA